MSSLELLEWQTKLALDHQVSALMTTNKMEWAMANQAVWTDKD